MSKKPHLLAYTGVTDIMRLFGVGYPKAQEIFKEAQSVHSSYYDLHENKVLLEHVLDTLGIQDKGFFAIQQEIKFNSENKKEQSPTTKSAQISDDINLFYKK